MQVMVACIIVSSSDDDDGDNGDEQLGCSKQTSRDGNRHKEAAGKGLRCPDSMDGPSTSSGGGGGGIIRTGGRHKGAAGSEPSFSGAGTGAKQKSRAGGKHKGTAGSEPSFSGAGTGAKQKSRAGGRHKGTAGSELSFSGKRTGNTDGGHTDETTASGIRLGRSEGISITIGGPHGGIKIGDREMQGIGGGGSGAPGITISGSGVGSSYGGMPSWSSICTAHGPQSTVFNLTPYQSQFPSVSQSQSTLTPSVPSQSLSTVVNLTTSSTATSQSIVSNLTSSVPSQSLSTVVNLTPYQSQFPSVSQSQSTLTPSVPSQSLSTVVNLTPYQSQFPSVSQSQSTLTPSVPSQSLSTVVNLTPSSTATPIPQSQSIVSNLTPAFPQQSLSTVIDPTTVMQFTEGDLAIATKDFSDSSKLGAGGFGIVYKGFVNGCNIAVKKLTQVWKKTNKSFCSQILH